MAPSLDCRNIAHHLDSEWREALIKPDGSLNRSGLARNVKNKHRIPRAFIDAFNAKFPSETIEEYVPKETSSAAHPVRTKRSTRRHSGEDADESEEDDDTEVGKKRQKFSWFMDDWAGEDDDYNQRNLNGTLREITEYSGAYTDSGVEIDINQQNDFPAELLTDEFIETWDALFQVNGRVFYDAEHLAIGGLEQREYFIVPSNYEIPPCPIADVGGGLKRYKVKIPIVAAVYILAKRQAVELGYSAEDQVKWATIRMEAFKSGWFDNQKYTMRKKAPDNCMTLMTADREAFTKHLAHAYTLCAFIPFMAEFFFRTYGGAYGRNNATEYMNKVRKFADSAGIPTMVGYMDADLLFGKALAWIGMKRPKLVLTRVGSNIMIPSPFVIRTYGSPAGAAVITTSMAVIQSIEAAGWWASIKRAASYDDTRLRSCAAKIARSPWSYHIMSAVYEVPHLSQEDAEEFSRAKEDAVKFAPILQAYLDTVVHKAPLGSAKTLVKHSEGNKTLYLAAKSLFRSVIRGRAMTITEVFGNEAFRLEAPEGPHA